MDAMCNWNRMQHDMGNYLESKSPAASETRQTCFEKYPESTSKASQKTTKFELLVTGAPKLALK